MVRKAQMALIVAAVSAALAAPSQAATLNLDLRFAPEGNPAGITGKTATIDPSTGLNGGNYTLQVWAQITDPSQAFQNAALNNVNFNLQSSHLTPVGALAGGGLISPAALASTATGGNALAASSNISTDGISDWGNATTTTNANWVNWQNSSGTMIVGFPFGTPSAVSRQVPGNANAWEILLATFTVNASQLVAQDEIPHQTAILIGSMDKYRTSPTVTSPANTWVVGGVIQNSKNNTSLMALGGTDMTDRGSTVNTGTGLSVGTGVVFNLAPAVPEPASLGLFAIGGLALLARRRKA